MVGRPPEAGQSRDKYLRVRLTGFEARYLDQLRDGQSRSQYVRQLIEAAATERGLT